MTVFLVALDGAVVTSVPVAITTTAIVARALIVATTSLVRLVVVTTSIITLALPLCVLRFSILALLVLQESVPITLHRIRDVVVIHLVLWVEWILILFVRQPLLHFVRVAVPQHTGERVVSEKLRALSVMHHRSQLA